MARSLNKFLALLLALSGLALHAQKDSTTGPKPAVYKDFKSDSSFRDFSQKRGDVARAQVKELKNGALLVRLKTNQKAIDQLKAAGKMDYATQIERETQQTNKVIMRAYLKEFTFCPVYFFFSQYSDSVKHQHLQGIFADTNLQVDPSIVCNARFYLVAEQGNVYSSSLGLVPLSEAPRAQESGTATKEVSVVIKNRYFIQLHEPFPYYQKGYNLKKYAGYIASMNERLTKFYEANKDFAAPSDIRELVY